MGAAHLHRQGPALLGGAEHVPGHQLPASFILQVQAVALQCTIRSAVHRRCQAHPGLHVSMALRIVRIYDIRTRTHYDQGLVKRGKRLTKEAQQRLRQA
eukprot:1139485-Pelagomonas_calceolata.AAC.9